MELNNKIKTGLFGQRKKKEIIIYGKDIFNQEYVTTALEAKYKVRYTKQLSELVNWVGERHPHLLIFEVGDNRKTECKFLKNLLVRSPKIKILVIIDKSPTKDVAEILKIGALDVFPKPYEPQLFVERVEALLVKS